MAAHLGPFSIQVGPQLDQKSVKKAIRSSVQQKGHQKSTREEKWLCNKGAGLLKTSNTQYGTRTRPRAQGHHNQNQDQVQDKGPITLSRAGNTVADLSDLAGSTMSRVCHCRQAWFVDCVRPATQW